MRPSSNDQHLVPKKIHSQPNHISTLFVSDIVSNIIAHHTCDCQHKCETLRHLAENQHLKAFEVLLSARNLWSADLALTRLNGVANA